jgi:hypothetical protein
MTAAAKTRVDASRALMHPDVAYIGELEVVNDSDTRALVAFVRAQIKKDKKLRIFVASRVEKKRA